MKSFDIVMMIRVQLTCYLKEHEGSFKEEDNFSTSTAYASPLFAKVEVERNLLALFNELS